MTFLHFLGRASIEPKLVNNVVTQRTKEYAVRQQEMEMEAKYVTCHIFEKTDKLLDHMVLPVN